MAPAAGMSFQPTQAPPRHFGKHIVHILISINFGMKSNSFLHLHIGSQHLYDAGPSSYYLMATAEGTQGKYLIRNPNLSCSSYFYEYFK